MDEHLNQSDRSGGGNVDSSASSPSIATSGTSDEVKTTQEGPSRSKDAKRRYGFDFKFWILVFALCLIYIAMRNYYDKLWGEEQALEEVVKNLRSESITLNAKLMQTSKESEVARMVEEREIDLEESRRPPIRIKYYER